MQQVEDVLERWNSLWDISSSDPMCLLTVTSAGDTAMAGPASLQRATSDLTTPNGNAGSRQYAVLQQYRDSLEARSTPRLEKKLPHLANPQPGASAEVRLHRFESHSPTIVNNSQQQQARHSKLTSQLEQRRSLLTPIIPPGVLIKGFVF